MHLLIVHINDFGIGVNYHKKGQKSMQECEENPEEKLASTKKRPIEIVFVLARSHLLWFLANPPPIVNNGMGTLQGRKYVVEKAHQKRDKEASCRKTAEKLPQNFNGHKNTVTVEVYENCPRNLCINVISMGEDQTSQL